MGSTTPNLNLYKPANGETGWGTLVDGNWDTLDSFAGSISGGASIAAGSYSVRGLLGVNDGGTPNTIYGLAAKQILCRNPSSGVIGISNNVSQSVNLGVNGANGLDTGAMAGSTWYHFYFIRKTDGTVSAVASLVAPTTGPTLPAGYTQWAYCGAVYSDASTHLVLTVMRGSVMYYQSHLAAVTAGAPGVGVETPVDLTTFVPPNALSVLTDFSFTVTGSAISGFDLVLRSETADNSVTSRGIVQVAGGPAATSGTAELYLATQQILYAWSIDSGVGSSPLTNIFVRGFRVPNGDA